MRVNLFYYIFFAVGLVFAGSHVSAQCTLSIDNIQETSAITCNGACNGEITVTYSGEFGNVNFQWLDVYNNDLGVNSAVASGLCAGIYTVNITDANNCTVSTPYTLTESTAISYTVTRTNTTCGATTGELVIAGANGCNSAYQYAIDGGTLQSSGTFSSLAAGFYNITVQDACGCSSTFAEYITSTDGPNTNINFVEPVCFGEDNGSISIFAFGTPTITYSIDSGLTSSTNNVFTNLAPGVYHIVVQDGVGCESFGVVEMTEPDSIEISTSIVNETCIGNNGSVEFHAHGGTGAFQFSLNAGAYQTDSLFSALIGGNQNYSIKDANGCTVTGQVTLTTGAGPTINSVIATNPTCSDVCNGAVLVNATGNGTLTYMLDATSQASSSFTGVCDGIYNLSISDVDGCVSSQSVTLTAPSPPTAGFSASDTTGISPLSVAFTNSSTGATSYNWSFGDSLSSTSTDTDPSFIFTNTGAYTVTMVAVNGGCYDTAYATIYVSGEPGFTMPNVFTPNNDGVNDVFRPIMLGIETVEGAIYNRWGEKIYEWFGNNSYWDGYTHPAGQLAPEGVYYYVLSAVDINGTAYEEQGIVYLMR